MDIEAFREAFPEFSDASKYTDETITFWSDLGERQLPEARWGTIWYQAVMIYTAHLITIAVFNSSAAAGGGSPGGPAGPLSSKAVGKVSAGYDTASSSEKDAGWFNLTVYGKQFYRLMMIYGAGVIQL